MDYVENMKKKIEKTGNIDFNIENFYSKNNENRYKSYLYNFVFTYLRKYNIKKYIHEENIDVKHAGIFFPDDNVSCIIPKRKTLYDEMVCIHELTRLVNILSQKEKIDSKYEEIIPYFNEYHYLRLINEFYAKQYELYRLNSIKEKINDNKDYYNHLYAYLVLKNRTRNYDIDTLNKINSQSKGFEKKLMMEEYTI